MNDSSPGAVSPFPLNTKAAHGGPLPFCFGKNL